MRRLIVSVPGLLAAALALGVWIHPTPNARSSTAAAFSLASRVPALSRGDANSLSDIQWTEQVYTAGAGEPVDVSVSTSYAAGDDIGRHWADFFASLPHGGELELLKVYVAPIDQVQAVCGMHAVGCYGDDELVLVNEPTLGFAPEEIARHEYGHHIAHNRLNTPWQALDWGPKHWATAANICARVHSGSAYPGDEFLLYKLNPGEAFAETYRVLVDTELGQTQPSWPLVDSSFYPDQRELDAVEQDVAAPWTGPTTHAFHPHLNRRSVWERRLSTPLDGTVTLDVAAPTGVDARVTLLAADRRPIREVGRSSRGNRITVIAQICGERSVTALVRAAGSRGGRIEVRVTVP